MTHPQGQIETLRIGCMYFMLFVTCLFSVTCIITWEILLKLGMHPALELQEVFCLGDTVMKDADGNVRRLADVATELIAVADKGHDQCHDENCVSLFGLAKDCGYRIRLAAEREMAAHELKLGQRKRRSATHEVCV